MKRREVTPEKIAVVREYLAAHGPCIATSIARHLKMPKRTVAWCLRYLNEDGEATFTVGRRPLAEHWRLTKGAT